MWGVRSARLLFWIQRRWVAHRQLADPGGRVSEGRGADLHTVSCSVLTAHLPSPPTTLPRYRMFTARAASRAMVASEMSDCSIMRTFAQRESTGTSVGEKAVLVLKAMKR